MRLSFTLFAFLVPTLTAGPALAASNLTGQHALYNFTLSKLRTHDITGATGQMAFDVVDGCTGWATTQHMTLIIRNVDGSLDKTVSDYMTWETKDGKTLTFATRESDNDGPEQVDDAGSATRGPDGSGVVTYTTPANTQYSLPPGTLFPMQHTEALLAAGDNGQGFISPPLFDGTDSNGAQATFVAVLKHYPGEKSAWPGLDGIPSTDVDIAFYARKSDDENPNFRTSMRYYENGVADNLVLDFGDFVMTGKLVRLSIPPSPCPGKRD
jgi:hypothetical protein